MESDPSKATVAGAIVFIIILLIVLGAL